MNPDKISVMVSRVRLSVYSAVLTAVMSLVILGVMVWSYGTAVFLVTAGIFAMIILFTLLYCPLYIAVDDRNVIIGSPLRNHRVPLEKIENVEAFQPTMGSVRICGSAGFMGYWGIFKENDVGRYCGYYGKASECFLVRMKNGDKYLLGCKNPAGMIATISGKLGVTDCRRGE